MRSIIHRINASLLDGKSPKPVLELVYETSLPDLLRGPGA